MEMEGYQSPDSGPDSDEELQEAFRTGKLQTGLNIVKEKPVKTFVNNEKAMLAKLEDFRQNLPWIERLDSVNVPAPLAPELRMDQEQLVAQQQDDSLAMDDFKRETMFYRQAQACVLQSVPRLQTLGVPTRRPDDYLAQMVKTDQQMDKVRKFLIRQKTSKELSAKARKLRELKKTGKRTQIEAQQRKQKEKKDMLEKVKKFRKGTEKSLDFLEGPEDESQNRHQRAAGKGKLKKKVNAKRAEKDAQFGHGGRKRGTKRNTAESAADTTWVGKGKPRGGKKFVTGKKTQGKPGSANKRPGKQARRSMKGKGKKK